MKSRIFSVLVFLFLAISSPLYSQTAVKLEALLETPELTWEQAAAFILEAADVEIPAMEASPTGLAFSFAMEQKWLPKKASLSDTALHNGVALLLMRSFNIKGGIFYRISKSPHHAYRELVYKNVIRGNVDPYMPVSGPELLFMVNLILAMKEHL